MIDFRPLLFVTGLLLAALAAMMLIPATVDWATGDSNWQEFLGAAFLTGFVGVGLSLSNRVTFVEVGVRQMFVLTAMIWLVIATFGALPLYFSDLGLTYTDAFFEAMSGITTTGSTVISGLDSAPIGVLLWRALLQWLGGIGIIVMAIAVMPMLRVGGMQLFRMESSDQSDKALPRVAHIAAATAAIYAALTAIWAGAYWLAGMTGFEAIAHAMTTIATGGYSTSDGSIGHFDSATIDAIATAGMIVGSLPFVLYLQSLRGQGTALFRDSQVRVFVA
ncbi:MAG: TrkH family potassium uptake protein, partial [Alphaproteobacteria bacterium]|nr:TrkH family potassium uptake protein [Alphaproteobacteria bacterium]